MIRVISFLAVLLWSIHPVQAATWDELAARFGCTSKAHASEQAGGSQYIMEFVPQGQKLGSQHRMFTITLTRTSQVDVEANQQIDQVIKSMAGAIGRSGAKLVEFTGYKGPYGPTAFFEFVLKGEYNMGVIQRTGPGMIAVQQLATFNGRRASDVDRVAIKAMLGLE